jgi:hypothetical protein
MEKNQQVFHHEKYPICWTQLLFRHSNFRTITSQEACFPIMGLKLTIIITGPVLRIFGGWQAPFFAFLAWPVPHTYTLSAIFDYMACLVFDREWIG